MFNLDKLIIEYKSRAIQLLPVFGSNNVKIPTSIAACIRSYDTYDLFDISLSRIIVEALIYPSFHKIIKIHFSHYAAFDDLPGQVYIMMVLYVCNSSILIDIEGASTPFESLALKDFRGEKLSALSTTAFKYIKIMKGVYALHSKLGTILLLKVQKTESEIFNQSILDHYATADEMETKYFLKDPKIMISNPLYSTHSLVGCCGYIRDDYSKLFKNGRLPPVLTNVQTPEVHHTPKYLV